MSLLRSLISRIALFFYTFFRQVLWFFPFVFFLIGYYITQHTIGSQVLQAPHLTGKELHDAVRILAPYRLNLRILDEVEEPAMAEGTILEQRPAPGQTIKIHQPLGVVLSRQPKPLLAPSFVGLHLSDIQKQAEIVGIRIKVSQCKSDIYPDGQCIAQSPTAGAVVTDKTVTVYITSQDVSLYLLPGFVGLPLDRVCGFLHTYSIPFEIVPHEYARHVKCPVCTVTAQKPLAGSFVSRANPPTVKLHVEHGSANHD